MNIYLPYLYFLELKTFFLLKAMNLTLRFMNWLSSQNHINLFQSVIFNIDLVCATNRRIKHKTGGELLITSF